MITLRENEVRPSAFETAYYPWNLRRVPDSIRLNGRSVPNPGRHCAVFVVHGMGQQEWTETATQLRSHFEDAFEAISQWQIEKKVACDTKAKDVPPPFIYEGYWADYASLKKSFPLDWEEFNKREQLFFSHLWKQRSYSGTRTLLWLAKQQLRLLNVRRMVWKGSIPLGTWLVYLSLQFLLPIALLVALIRAPRIITRIIADVRIYAAPKGMTELAIVQRIDYRVAQEFLRLIGLDCHFRKLKPCNSPIDDQHVMASGKPCEFDRVIWVAHSLGTVISYNVLSDLFNFATFIDEHGDDEQRQGVKQFRDALCRFVTMGSPLDKFAFLFPSALRPWPLSNGSIDRSRLLPDTGDDSCLGREWWINFYSVMDPVSGMLHNTSICGPKAPASMPAKSNWLAWIPGVAHSSYWSAPFVLRFILGRAYGKTFLPDKEIKPRDTKKHLWYAILGYFVWVVALYGTLIALVALIYYHKEILNSEYFKLLWKMVS